MIIGSMERGGCALTSSSSSSDFVFGFGKNSGMNIEDNRLKALETRLKTIENLVYEQSTLIAQTRADFAQFRAKYAIQSKGHKLSAMEKLEEDIKAYAGIDVTEVLKKHGVSPVQSVLVPKADYKPDPEVDQPRGFDDWTPPPSD